jgi:hypothetical protein
MLYGSKGYGKNLTRGREGNVVPTGRRQKSARETSLVDPGRDYSRPGEDLSSPAGGSSASWPSSVEIANDLAARTQKYC